MNIYIQKYIYISTHGIVGAAGEAGGEDAPLGAQLGHALLDRSVLPGQPLLARVGGSGGRGARGVIGFAEARRCRWRAGPRVGRRGGAELIEAELRVGLARGGRIPRLLVIERRRRAAVVRLALLVWRDELPEKIVDVVVGSGRH